MENDGTTNDQVTDSISQLNTLLLSASAPQSLALLDVTGAESMGMALHNAVSSQHNAQISAGAAITSVCAKILQVPTAVSTEEPGGDKKKDIPPFLPLSGNSADDTSALISQAQTLVKNAENMDPKELDKLSSVISDLQSVLAQKHSSDSTSSNTTSSAAPDAAKSTSADSKTTEANGTASKKS